MAAAPKAAPEAGGSGSQLRGLRKPVAGQLALAPDGGFLMGNGVIDPTHTLAHHRGTVLCWVCRGWSSGQAARTLGAPCIGHALASAKNVDSRLRHGLSPHPSVPWPLEEGEGLASGFVFRNGGIHRPDTF